MNSVSSETRSVELKTHKIRRSVLDLTEGAYDQVDRRSLRPPSRMDWEGISPPNTPDVGDFAASKSVHSQFPS